MTAPFMIGIAGTHSTGKSTFVQRVAKLLTAKGLQVGQIGDLATKARSLGFPILTEHTYESTLWIISEGMRQEMEALICSDVVLVDRPAPDALGYLLAALEVSKRSIDEDRLSELDSIASAHSSRYDIIIVTVLDPHIALGDDRDSNKEFRSAAARHVTSLIKKYREDALMMTSQNTDEVIQIVAERLTSLRRRT